MTYRTAGRRIAAIPRSIRRTGAGTDPMNWVEILDKILRTTTPYVEGDSISQLPKRGDARQVLLFVCERIQARDIDKAVQTLADAFASDLNSEMWADLSQHFPEDVSLLLPTDLRKKFADMLKGNDHHAVQPTKEGGNPIQKLPGGFMLYGVKRNLPPKPLGVLNCLIDSRHNRSPFPYLSEKVWGVNSGASEQNVKDAVKTLRKMLREAYEKAKGIELKEDPIPCVGKGTDLAWELRLDLLQ
jgi:hypothetical protein